MLKNKYDLTLCQSCLHNASKIFIRHKKIQIGFDFFAFFAPVASIRGVLTVQSHRTSERQNSEWRLQVHPLRLAAQSTYRSLHTDKETSLIRRGNSLSSLYLRNGWTQNLLSFSFFKKAREQQNHPQYLKTPFSRLLFSEFFHNGLINTHRTQCARFLCVTNF